MTNHAVGIDLGSRRFVIAVVKKGGVEVLSNDANYRITPTLVSYGVQRMMGDTAKPKVIRNLKNTIFHPTRHLGQKTLEQANLEKKYEFSRSKQENHKTVFSVNYDG